MLTIIQIGALAFATFAASRAILRTKDKKISVLELLFWLGIWSGLIFVVFFPVILSKVAEIIGIGRGSDVIVYMSVALLFYMIFRLYVKLDETQNEITKVVREMALEKNRRKR